MSHQLKISLLVAAVTIFSCQAGDAKEHYDALNILLMRSDCHIKCSIKNGYVVPNTQKNGENKIVHTSKQCLNSHDKTEKFTFTSLSTDKVPESLPDYFTKAKNTPGAVHFYQEKYKVCLPNFTSVKTWCTYGDKGDGLSFGATCNNSVNITQGRETIFFLVQRAYNQQRLNSKL